MQPSCIPRQVGVDDLYLPPEFCTGSVKKKKKKYIYIYVCVCVCVHIHIKSIVYINIIYMLYICMCVYICEENKYTHTQFFHFQKSITSPGN